MNTDHDPESEEYGLFISGDGLRATDAPWRLGDYAVELPLSVSQLAELASNHKLEPSILQKLSKHLGYVLNPSDNIHLVPASRSRGKKRSADDLSYSAAQIGAVSTRLEEILDRLATLTIDTVDESPDLINYDLMLEQLERAYLAATEVRTALEGFAKRPELFLKLEPVDRRVLHDRRRSEVLGAIFQAWVEAGRKISFTTDPLTSKRGGALVLFAQDVCALLTDPPTQISGEAIAKQIIKSGRAYRPMSEWLSVFIDPEN